MIDFYDFGTGRGNSMVMASRIWGGVGVGYESSDSRRAEAIRRGLDCKPGDMLEIMPALPANSASYVVLNHILEHMTDARRARNVIEDACRIAAWFVFMAGPWFDSDGYLLQRGVKLFASDWPTDHLTAVTSLMVRTACSDVLTATVTRLVIWGRQAIESTDHHYIYALPENVRGLPHPYRYIKGTHLDKPHGVALHGCFYELCAMAITEGSGDDDIRKFEVASKSAVRIHDERM